MSIPLVQVLEQMNLEPGRRYRYQVKGRQVELRVLEDSPPEMLPTSLVESDVMLDPWVELPPPSGGIRIHAKPGEFPPPDLPEMPSDEENS
jgi:hypothetical protein